MVIMRGTMGEGLAVTLLSAALVVHRVALPGSCFVLARMDLPWFGCTGPLEATATTVLASHAPQ